MNHVKQFAAVATLVALIAAVAEARPGGGGGRGGTRAGGGRAGGQRQAGNVGGQVGGDASSKMSSGVRSNGGLQASGFSAQGPARQLDGGVASKQQIERFLGSQPYGADGQRDGASTLQLEQGAIGSRQQGQVDRDQAAAHATQLQQNAQSWLSDFNGGNEPFTAGWYADHPQAWQYTHPHADAWAAANLTTATAWLGWAAYGDAGSTTVVTETTEYAEISAESVPTATGQTVAEPAAVDGEWLSLGVYALAPPAGGGQQMVHLAVSRAGVIQGVYVDNFSALSTNVAGTVNSQTQEANWHLESNPQVQFRASLTVLTAPHGEITVIGADGQPQGWMLVRLESPK